MKVAILFDDVMSRPAATPDERGVLEAVRSVKEALRLLKHEAILIPAVEEVSGWRKRLQDVSPDVVFNLCEGLGGGSEGEVLAATVVEDLGFPMTGSPSSTLALARRKDRANALLQERGLVVPAWAVWPNPQSEGEEGSSVFAAKWNTFPAIVKPVAEDGSVGIDQGAVVSDAKALRKRLENMKALGPLMVQAFVGTREINAGILGGEVLPLSEIVFTGLPAGHHPIVGYEAKWSPGSPEDRGTQPVCPAPLPGALASRVRLMALRAWRAVGGRGYGRVDFRISPPDNAWILEVNPNPDLSPSGGLARAATVEGLTYAVLVEKIVQRSLA